MKQEKKRKKKTAKRKQSNPKAPERASERRSEPRQQTCAPEQKELKILVKLWAQGLLQEPAARGSATLAAAYVSGGFSFRTFGGREVMEGRIKYLGVNLALVSLALRKPSLRKWWEAEALLPSLKAILRDVFGGRGLARASGEKNSMHF